MNFEKRFIGKHETAAHEELEILEWQHTTTAAAGNDVADILQKQQHTTTTKMPREELAGEAEQL